MDSKIHISPAHEPALLMEVANGDEVAFATLLRTHWFRIYHYAQSFLKSGELAEEFTQDVFVRLWQNREKLKEVDSFPDYLFILSRNLLFTRLRSKVLQNEPLEDAYAIESSLLADQQLSAKELSTILARAIEQLPPQQKTTFRYVHDEKLSYQEIADKMQISKRTVRFHMAAALAYVRSYIHQEYTDPI